LLASRPTPTWRTSVSLFVWLLPLDLSGLSGLTSSYATADLYPTEVSWFPGFLLQAESTSGATMRLEGLGQLKTPMTSSRIDTATSRLVT
jgi:hypothetical protein